VTRKNADAGNIHADSKKTELDEFADRLRNDISDGVIQQTRAAKTQIDQHTSKHSV